MTSVVRGLRAKTEEFDRWEKAAKLNGKTYNGWARWALNSQAALDEALEREKQRDQA